MKKKTNDEEEVEEDDEVDECQDGFVFDAQGECVAKYSKFEYKKITGEQDDASTNVNNAYRNTNKRAIIDAYDPDLPDSTAITDSMLINYCKQKCDESDTCKGFNYNTSNKTCWFKDTNASDKHEVHSQFHFYRKDYD